MPCSLGINNHKNTESELEKLHQEGKEEKSEVRRKRSSFVRIRHVSYQEYSQFPRCLGITWAA